MLGYSRFPGSEGGCGTCPPVFLTKGLGLALSECLLLAANPAAARCPGESVHWKEPVPHEQRPAGTVMRGPEMVLSLSPPPPHTHAHAPRMKASGTPALPPDSVVPVGADGSQRSPGQTDSGQCRHRVSDAAAPGAHGAACSRAPLQPALPLSPGL